jgi:hypothetical protein
MALTETTETRPEVRPFRIDVPEAELVDLRRRILATRFWGGSGSALRRASTESPETSIRYPIPTPHLLRGFFNSAGSYNVVMTSPPGGSITMTISPDDTYGGLHVRKEDVTGIELVPSDPPVTWQLQMTRPGGANLQDMEV